MVVAAVWGINSPAIVQEKAHNKTILQRQQTGWANGDVMNKIEILTSMKKILVLFLTFLVYGCSSDYAALSSSKSEDFYSTMQEKQRSKNKYLAYTHSITVTVEKAKLPVTFESVIESCINDTEHTCLIMHSSQDGGRYASGSIMLRVVPEGIPKYISLVSESGEVGQKSTTAEDLTDSVVDTEKRLEMLETYQEKLKKLEQNSNINIESLIKVSSEISDVQTKLEYAQGQKSKLYQRINMDVLTISLRTEENETFLSPISESLSNFGEDLSEGVAIFITTTAYLMPWVILVTFFVWLIRFVWARSKRGKKS